MKCPKCKHPKQRVSESRPFGEETYRRRICLNCGYRFVTYEKADEGVAMHNRVMKRYPVVCMKRIRQALEAFKAIATINYECSCKSEKYRHEMLLAKGAVNDLELMEGKKK